MNTNPLISVIIPTYNRASLIGETLESILAQTYTNWECIVVDDGSTDNTKQLLENYTKKDGRFKFYKRPTQYKKGACSCRNFGYENSKGDAVCWFDSDDIMYINFLEVKIKELRHDNKLDFVVSRCVNFFEDGTQKEMGIRNNQHKKLSHNNFVLFEVYWITGNFLVWKKSVKDIRFDAELPSNQEFNFFVKLIGVNNLNGLFINQVLFKRRMHAFSIQHQLFGKQKVRNKYLAYKRTFEFCKNYLNNEARHCLFNHVSSSFFELARLGSKLDDFKNLFKIYLSEKGRIKTLLYFTSIFIAKKFKKGYALMKVSR